MIPSPRPIRGLARALVATLVLVILTGCSKPSSSLVFRDANLLLVSLDTLRADHMSAYGYERPTSPFLDAVASEGILFETVIVQSTWTTPSHAALFTSRYPTELGLRTWPDPGRIPDEFPTIAEILADEGFSNHAFTESGWIAGSLGFERGFLRYDDRGGRFRAILPRARTALSLFGDDRFFVFLHTYDVHEYDPAFAALEPFLRPYDGRLSQGGSLAHDVQTWKNEEWREALRPSDLDYLIDLYDGAIREVDDALREFLGQLDAEGRLDETILVITADHGEEFMEHGRTGHGYSAYDEQILVPLIIRLPGKRLAGTRVKEPVRSIDILPTLLDLLGVDSDVEMRGQSLVPLMRGGDAPGPSFVDRGHVPKVAIRTERYKVILDTKRNRFEAYDIEKDPDESIDLLRVSPAAVPEELRTALREWLDGLESPENLTETPALTEEQRKRIEQLGYAVPESEGGGVNDDTNDEVDRRE